MSEKKEKYIRKLEKGMESAYNQVMDAGQLIQELKEQQAKSDKRYEQAMEIHERTMELKDRAYKSVIEQRDREREKARQAQRLAKHYKVAAYMAAVLGPLIMVLALLSVAGGKPAEEPAEIQAPTQMAVREERGKIAEQPAVDPLAGFRKIEDVTVTHYCICQKCCGKAPGEPGYGITASGEPAVPGYTIAVDPDLIPLGTEILLDTGDGVLTPYRADDTGGAVKGAHIDVCETDHATAVAAGVQVGTVYIQEEI